MFSGNQGYQGYQGNQNFGSGLGQFISGFSNTGAPYQAAGNEYKNYFNQGINTQNPFYQAGTRAIPNYENALAKYQHPDEFINKLMNNYQMSPFAKFLQQQADRYNTNKASAEGTIGSTPYQQAGEQYAHDISSEDMNNWLSQVLGVNNQYLQGQQNLIGSGQNSANQMTAGYQQAAPFLGGARYGERAGRNIDFGNIIGGGARMFENGLFG